MKIYHISQDVVSDYDTYSDAVVVAESEQEAREICPSGYYKFHDNEWYFQFADGTESIGERSDWSRPEDVKVKYIGDAAEEIKKGVICASFHAG